MRGIYALILAAGLSSRMQGQHKILLPWKEDRTILEHIVAVLRVGGVETITVITGYKAEDVEQSAARAGAATVHNANYAAGEMLSSLKVGLAALPSDAEAALIALGDQPRIQPQTVAAILAAYQTSSSSIIAPSYQMRRGHPILLARSIWEQVLALPDSATLRDVLQAHPIQYVLIDNDSILSDVDTPDDYQQERGK